MAPRPSTSSSSKILNIDVHFPLLRYHVAMLARMLAIAILFSSSAVASDPAPKINFDRDIRPILADACYTCHGPHSEKRKARLRLDLRDSLFGPTRDASDAARDESLPSHIISPGSIEKSELARRISATDEDDVMPPPDGPRQITSAERETILQWIKQGAEWSAHWAFEAVQAIELPHVQDNSWSQTNIDRFILAEIQKHTLTPSKQADKLTLIRRLSLDLTGLPPSQDETAAYLADAASNAYEKLVDRLLASPRFGEHFAASWLEVARYADSNGFQLDPDRTAWPWRDWVIEAFNSNLPYDKFIVDQIAGDLQPQATPSNILASAFNRNHPINGEGGQDIEESRIGYVHDRVETTSTAFLGLTVSCAQCHDHKYDPISQRDYYRFFAYFNSIDETGAGDKGDMPPVMDFIDSAGSTRKVMVMDELKQARKTHVLERGAWDHPGEPVEPGTPSALPEIQAQPNRLGLATWITSPSNPLAARVAVNRFWQQIFGQGLVRTPDNFGVQGERPTHPELLDYLARTFVESGWDTKALVRLMVTSATYQQTSVCSSELLQQDPENRLLARAPRYRLPSAVLRDQALFASGLLIEKLGGPPVKPYHPPGVWEDVSFGRLKYVAGTGEDLYRRSLYTFWRRTAPPANMFDVTQRQKCSVRVIRTNTPLQALTLMNDPTFAEAAAALAERSLRDGGDDDSSRIAWAVERVVCRPPTPTEIAVLSTRLKILRDYYSKNADQARAAACSGDRPDPQPEKFTEIAAYSGVISIIFNLDEALTRE